MDIIQEISTGIRRVCNKNSNGIWESDEQVKNAILALFQNPSVVIQSECSSYFDKIQLKTKDWDSNDFKSSGFRISYGAVVRNPSFIDIGCVIMPSFINVGAYIGAKTMIDSNVTIGSCAQIGKNCHIGSGTTIAGVLEPAQALPVIIEDHCFIGANSVISEGAIIKTGCVIGAGACITQSMKIVNKITKKIISIDEVPEYSVLVPGSIVDTIYGTQTILAGTACLILVKTVDKQTREKTSINELLRD